VHELGRDQPKTTKELLDITTRHASGEEAVRAVFIQGDGKAVHGGSWWALPKAVGKGVRRSAKGNKRGPKRCPQQVTITTSYNDGDNDKEVDDSNEEHVTTVEHDFKH
jgi:hypothetical protein